MKFRWPFVLRSTYERDLTDYRVRLATVGAVLSGAKINLKDPAVMKCVRECPTAQIAVEITNLNECRKLILDNAVEHLVLKWSPVLKKMPEIQSEHHKAISILFENSAIDCGSQLPDANWFNDFTRFALPMIRKIFAKLVEANMKISPVMIGSSTSTTLVKIGPTFHDIADLKMIDTVNKIDSEAELTDRLSTKIADDILSIVNINDDFKPVLLVKKTTINGLVDILAGDDSDLFAFMMEYVK